VKIKTRILWSTTFFRKSCLLWDNVEKYGRVRGATNDVTIWLIRVACWISKATCTHAQAHAYEPTHTHAWAHAHTRVSARTHKHTHIYVILIAFQQERFTNVPEHDVIRTLSVLLYVHCLSCYTYIVCLVIRTLSVLLYVHCLSCYT
jgi:hypothetical protein